MDSSNQTITTANIAKVSEKDCSDEIEEVLEIALSDLTPEEKVKRVREAFEEMGYDEDEDEDVLVDTFRQAIEEHDEPKCMAIADLVFQAGEDPFSMSVLRGACEKQYVDLLRMLLQYQDKIKSLNFGERCLEALETVINNIQLNTVNGKPIDKLQELYNAILATKFIPENFIKDHVEIANKHFVSNLTEAVQKLDV